LVPALTLSQVDSVAFWVIGQLLVQLRGLLAQGLQLWLGLGFDGVAGTVNFGGELVQIR
jgi:hypothetical protein